MWLFWGYFKGVFGTLWYFFLNIFVVVFFGTFRYILVLYGTVGYFCTSGY